MSNYDDSILLDADHVKPSPFFFDSRLGRDFGTVIQFPRLGEIQRPSIHDGCPHVATFSTRLAAQHPSFTAPDQ